LAQQKDLDGKKGTTKNAKGLSKKTYGKRGNPKKTQRGSSKRPLMKKEATLRNMKGVIKKTSNKKRGNPKKKGEALLKNAARRGTITRKRHSEVQPHTNKV
jgi:hypothetical protein